MKHWLRCLGIVLLCMCLGCGFTPQTGEQQSPAARRTYQNEQIPLNEEELSVLQEVAIPLFDPDKLQNVILVVDVTSESGVSSDILSASRQSLEAACALATELLPLENVQLGMIAYGYKEGPGVPYSFQQTEQHMPDGAYIHQLSGLDEPTDFPQEHRKNLLTELQSAMDADTRKSPHGQALLAATDMLEAAGAKKGAACVILISDGVPANSVNNDKDRSFRDQAVHAAALNLWPIYTIELNMDTNYEYDTQDHFSDPASESVEPYAFPHSMMTQIAQDSGALRTGPDGNMPGNWVIELARQDADTCVGQITRAVAQILAGTIEDRSFDELGTLAIPCPVTNLTCEYQVCFLGTGLKTVQVFFNSAPVEDDPRVHVVQGDGFLAVRLLCPDPGNWTVAARGEANRSVTVRTRKLVAPEMEVELHNSEGRLQCGEDGKYLVVKKDTPLFATASFRYGETTLIRDLDDQSVQVFLELDADTQNGTYSPYKGQLNDDDRCMNEYTEGNKWSSKLITLSGANLSPEENTGVYRLRVNLVRNGEESPFLQGDWFEIATEDGLFTASANKNIDLGTVPVFGKVPISLSSLGRNPDQDRLQFTVFGRDDAGESFRLQAGTEEPGISISSNQDEIYLLTNSCIGTYQLELNVKDPGSEDTHTFHVTMTVSNAPAAREDTQSVICLWDRVSWDCSDRPYRTLLWEDPEGAEVKLEVLTPTDSGVAVCTAANVSDSPSKACLQIDAQAPGWTSTTLRISDGATRMENGEQVAIVREETIHVMVLPLLLRYAPLIIFLLAVLFLFLRQVLLRTNEGWTLEIRDSSWPEDHWRRSRIPVQIPVSSIHRGLWLFKQVDALLQEDVTLVRNRQTRENEFLDINTEELISLRDAQKMLRENGAYCAIRVTGLRLPCYMLCVGPLPETDSGHQIIADGKTIRTRSVCKRLWPRFVLARNTLVLRVNVASGMGRGNTNELVLRLVRSKN